MAEVAKLTIVLDESGNVSCKSEGGNLLVAIGMIEVAKASMLAQTQARPRSPLDALSLPKMDISLKQNGHVEG